MMRNKSRRKQQAKNVLLPNNHKLQKLIPIIWAVMLQDAWWYMKSVQSSSIWNCSECAATVHIPMQCGHAQPSTHTQRKSEREWVYIHATETSEQISVFRKEMCVYACRSEWVNWYIKSHMTWAALKPKRSEPHKSHQQDGQHPKKGEVKMTEREGGV